MLKWLSEWHAGSRFLDRLSVACRANGWVPKFADGDGAVVALLDGDERFLIDVAHADGRVTLRAASDAAFPPGRFPPALAAALAERNAEGGPARWWVGEDADGGRAWAMATFPLVELDGDSLRSGAEAVLGEVETLDAGLRRRGLVPKCIPGGDT